MQRSQLDYWIIYTVLVLIAFGIIMVYSSSAFYADKFRHDHLYYLKRQLLWVFMGIILLLIVYKIPYEIFQRKSWILILLSFGLLMYLEIQNSGRWLNLGFFNIQVTDIARLSLIIFFADSLSRKERYLKDFMQGYFPHLFYIVLLAGLIVVQPDFSSAFMLTIIGLSMMFISPIPIKYFFYTFLMLLPVIAMIIRNSPYKVARITAFIHPETDILGKGYQINQSLMSLGSGGIAGVGFAKSIQKMFFLPEAHTDFIYAIVGEEWGILGTVFILTLYMIITWRAILLIKRIPDKFSKYLAFGLTINLIYYALINMMVAVHLAPPTGLPLPFISYGGSSMLISCISVGLLLNISSRAYSHVQNRNLYFANRAVNNLQSRRLRYIK